MKLLLSDLDGTLLGPEKQINLGDQRAIQAWVQKGNAFVIATGRLLPATKYYYDQLMLKGPLVTCSGAVIYNHEGQILQETPIPKEIAMEIWKICKSYNNYVQIYSGSKIYASHLAGPAERFSKFHELHGDKYRIEVIIGEEPELGEDEDHIHKVSFTYEQTEAQKEMLEEIRKVTDLSIFKSLPDLMDVIHPDSNKGEALKFLRSHYNLSPDQVFAIGDNENDIPMVEEASIGAIMDNAPEHVKVHGNFISKGHDDNGLAYFIEHLLKEEDHESTQED